MNLLTRPKTQNKSLKPFFFRDSPLIWPSIDFDDLLQMGSGLRYLRKNLDNLADLSTVPQIKMDITELSDHYVVHADVPGVKKEDIHVLVDGDRVSISAETRQEKESQEDEQNICCERSCGMTQRNFTLPSEVDSTQVQAKYLDGVLELSLPKKYSNSRKEIAIS